MKAQQYYWPELTRKIQDILFLAQQDMADKLHVSQQGISTWMTGIRNPGKITRRNILNLVTEHGIKAEFAELGLMKMKRLLRLRKGRDLVRMFELYFRMSKEDKKKFVRFAKKL